MVAGDKNDVFNEGVISFLHRHYPATGHLNPDAGSD